MRTLNRATLIALAAASALASAACNTVAGAGRDLENAGQAVTDAADETQQELKDAPNG
jgi:predicted small secreted protein